MITVCCVLAVGVFITWVVGVLAEKVDNGIEYF